MMEITNTLHSGMCRCCASEGTFKDIKTKYHWMGEEEVYADMLTDCFDIKICTPEDLDNGICEVCITQLRNAANFKKQVLHTEEQFKRRLQLKDVKNPIKLESVDEDPIESDHVSDPDFSGTEYEVPIKQEVDEKPKPRKRPAKATTSRAKKPKVEPESSKKQLGEGRQKVAKKKAGLTAKNEQKPSSDTPNKVQKGLVFKFREVKLHLENLRHVIRCSNATPIRAYGGIGYNCYFCDSEYALPTDLKKHTLETHSHNDKPFKVLRSTNYCMKMDITGLHCKLCELPFNHLEPLMDHLKHSHQEPIHTELKSHMIPFKFEGVQLKCAVCNVEFYNFHSLLDHMRKHYRNYICDICDEGYLNYNSLRLHRLSHIQGEYPCNECDKIFGNSVKLHSHMRSVHLRIKRNKCGYCGERFAERSWKLNHMEKVHGIKKPKFECNVCNKLCISLKTLDKHMRAIHMMEKSEECPICNMKFFMKDTLKQHMTVHTGVRAFECAVCSKSFARKTTLREHIRIHMNDRRFQCEDCSMTFIQKCSLKGHMWSKHGKEV